MYICVSSNTRIAITITLATAIVVGGESARKGNCLLEPKETPAVFAHCKYQRQQNIERETNTMLKDEMRPSV